MTTSIDAPGCGEGKVAESAPATGVLAAGSAARSMRLASWASTALGVASLAAFAPVLVRLLETWHVSARAASHHVSLLGLRLTYPTANLAAVVVLCLAALGMIATAAVVSGLGAEIRRSRALGARLAALRPVLRDGVLVIDDKRPESFCAGLLRPRIYITTGAIALLDPAGLDAVLAHERHHACRRDPLRLAVMRILGRALFFLPAVAELRRGQQLLIELTADEGAVAAAAGDRAALARAMLRFTEASAGGVEPARVDHLLGGVPAWRFPLLASMLALGALGLVVALVVLAGREAAGSATLAPPFLSAQPCITMLAGIPGAAVLLAARPIRRRV
jgi:Zn-dependent protease with chaperone function